MKNILKKGKLKNGFSLVELIVVIAIIGIVTAVVVPSIIAYMNKGAKNAAIAEAEVVKDDLNTWYKAFTEEEASSYRGKNLIYDFVDSEIEKEETYVNKLTYAYIPAGAATLYNEGSISKYYANGKDAFNDDYALIVYNNGSRSVPIVLPLSTDYYFTGNAWVYQDAFKNDSKLFKTYCGIESMTTANNIYNLKDRSVSAKFVDYNDTLVGNIYSGIEAGDKLTEVPSTASMYVPAGYTFTGKWQVVGTDVELDSSQILNYKITRDTTFKAVYVAKKYYINFYMQYNKTIGGTSYDYYDEETYIASGTKVYDYSTSQTLSYGSTLVQMAPQMDGYTFKGWMLDNGTKVLSNSSINATFSDVYEAIKKLGTIDDSGSETTINLYAMWEKESITVTLMGFNKGKVGSITVPYGSTITSSNITSYTSVNSALTTNSQVCNAYFGFTSNPGSSYSYIFSANDASNTNVGIPSSSAYNGWSWYKGSQTAEIFDVKTELRNDIVIYAQPNYKYYAATSQNSLISNLVNQDKNLYFKVSDSVIKGNEDMIISFFNSGSDSNGQLLALNLIAIKDGYHIYSCERNTTYSKFMVARKSNKSRSIGVNDILAASDALEYDSNTKKNVFIITSETSGKLNVASASGSDTYVTSVNKTFIDVSSVSNYSSYTYYVSYNGQDKQLSLVKNDINSLYLVNIPSGVTSYQIKVKSGSTVKYTSNTLTSSEAGGKLYYVTVSSTSEIKVANTLDNTYTVRVTWKKNSYKNSKTTKIDGNTKFKISYTQNGSTLDKDLILDTSNVNNIGGGYVEILGSYSNLVLKINNLNYNSKRVNATKSCTKITNGGTIAITNLDNTTIYADETNGTTSSTALTNDYYVSSTSGEINLIPSVGGLNKEEGGNVVGYLSLTGGVSTALRVLWNENGEQIWLGYDALDDETKESSIISKGSSSGSSLCEPININPSVSGSFRVSIVSDSNDDRGVPKVHIESSTERLINYYRVNANGVVEQVAYQTVSNESNYSKLYCSYLSLDTEGYTWSGEWYLNRTCTGETFNYTDSTGKVTSDLNLYAKMNANTFGLSYEPDLTKVSSTDISSYPTTYTYDGTTFDLPKLEDPTGYYRFDGWYLDSSFDTAVEQINNKTVDYCDDDGNITIYAKWTEATYIITYTLYGGEFTGGTNPNPSSYTCGQATFTLVDPVRTGYTFSGWYYDENCSEIVVDNKVDTTRGTRLDLYAKWVLEAPQSVELSSSTSADVIDLLANPVSNVTVDVNDSTVLTVEATLQHEVSNLTLNYKWLSTDNFSNYDEDEDVVSSNHSVTITQEGTYPYYVLIEYYDSTSKSVVQTLSYTININAYDSRLADDTVVYTGTAQKLDLPTSYASKLEAEGWTIGTPTMQLVNSDSTLTPVTEAIEPGKYYETITITKAGETDIVKTGYLTITKKPIYIINNAVFEHDNLEHSISIPVNYAVVGSSTYDEDLPTAVLEITGTVSATDVGSYSFTARIIDTAHYSWSDDSTGLVESKQINWKITQVAVNLPVDYSNGNGEVNYTGSEIDITEIIPEFASSTKYSIAEGSTTKATAVGTYTITLHLTSTDSCWWDGETSDKEVTWKIVKVTPTVITKPTASSVYDGDLLSDSTLSGGKVVINAGKENELVVTGTYSWDEPTKVVNYNYLSTSYAVTFTPDDLDSFDVVSLFVELKVDKLYIKVDNITVAPQANTYYSHYSSIQEVTFSNPGEVQLHINGADHVIEGTFDWADDTRKYHSSDATGGNLTVYVTFVPAETGKYNIDPNFSYSIQVPYVEDSYTVTLSGDNGHVPQYKVTYNNGKEQYVTVGTNVEIEVLKATPSITVTVNSWEVSSGFSFSYIIFDRTKQNNSTFNITKPGTILIATSAPGKNVEIINTTGLNITATAEVEDYDNYLATGNIYKTVTVTNGSKIPQNTIVTVTFNLDGGYKLSGITVRDAWWRSLYTTPLPTDQVIVNQFVITFESTECDVSITGTAQEMTTQVKVQIEADSAGLGTVYVKGDITGQISAADDPNDDGIIETKFGINASQSIYIECKCPSGYTVSSFLINNVAPSNFAEATTYKTDNITAANQNDQGEIVVAVRFGVSSDVLQGISSAVQEYLYDYRLSFSTSYSYELYKKVDGELVKMNQTNGYVENGYSILGIMIGAKSGMGYDVENYQTYYLKVKTTNNKLTFTSDNGYGDFMGFHAVNTESEYVTYRFQLLTTSVCTKISF